MASINFVFDIFVKSIASPKIDSEDLDKLQVNANFNGRIIRITPSRINVNDFNIHASTFFTEEDNVLRQNLEDCGMVLTVRYKKRPIGSGTVKFPENFIDSIKSDMPDLIHEDSCTFVKDKIEVGQLEFKCRLLIKCESPEEAQCRRNMDASINPQDILFLMAQSDKCSPPYDPCPDDLEPQPGDERLKLDLERYHSVPLPAAETAVLKKPNEAKEITGELKKFAKECEETITAILNGSNPPMQPIPITMQEVDNYNKVSEPGSCDSVKENQDKQNKIDNIPGVNPPRSCPICLNNMSWLPKFAACPRCGSKPMPVVEERLKDREPTADEIILEYLGKSQPTLQECCISANVNGNDDNPAQNEESFQCRCTCKRGKLCAHCRVREACKDIFKLNSDDELAPKSGRDRESKRSSKRISKAESQRPSILEADQDPDQSSQNESVPQPACPEEVKDDTENFDERRTHLARVFSELCLLYNIKNVNSLDQKQKQNQDEANSSEYSFDQNNQVDATRKSNAIESRRGTNEQQRKSKAGDAKDVLKGKKRKSKEAPIKPKWRSNISISSGSPRESMLSTQSEESREVYEEDYGEPLVPRRLGWDWRTHPASKKGWRPGAIRKPIKKIMDFFMQKPVETADDITRNLEIDKKEKEQKEKSMLRVCKKNGEISITLQSVDPAKKANPIIFKVAKSNQAVRLSEIKTKLKTNGFRKCTCHKSLMLCVCRTNEEKREVQDALVKECKTRRIPYCPDELVLTDTTDSEMEYDFEISPLLGAPILPPEDGPDAANMNKSTQTAEKDLIATRKYPIMQNNPYYIPYNCATRAVLLGSGDGSDEENGGYNARNYASNNRRDGRGNEVGKGRGNSNNNIQDKGGKGKRSKNGNGQIPVALPKRLQKDPNAAAKAEAAAKKQVEDDNKKTVMKKLIQMSKAPPIDRKNLLRALMTTIQPDIDAIPKLGKGISPAGICYCNPCHKPCYNRCYTSCVPECCPCYNYCC